MSHVMLLFLAAIAFNTNAADTPKPAVQPAPPLPSYPIPASEEARKKGPTIINGYGIGPMPFVRVRPKPGEYIGPKIRKIIGDPANDVAYMTCELTLQRITVETHPGDGSLRMSFKDLPKDLDMKKVGETILDIYRIPVTEYVAAKPSDNLITINASVPPGLKEFTIYRHDDKKVFAQDSVAAMELAKLVSQLCGEMKMKPQKKVAAEPEKPSNPSADAQPVVPAARPYVNPYYKPMDRVPSTRTPGQHVRGS